MNRSLPDIERSQEVLARRPAPRQTASDEASEEAEAMQALREDITKSRKRVEQALDRVEERLHVEERLRKLQEIKLQALRLQHHVTDLSSKARRHVRPEPLVRWAQGHPVESVAVAFAVGFLVGCRPRP